jgi:hypothetical protein
LGGTNNESDQKYRTIVVSHLADLAGAHTVAPLFVRRLVCRHGISRDRRGHFAFDGTLTLYPTVTLESKAK